ncbi:unnamed protein product [Gordionus sp. m RMFG-2023]|uniref:heparan-sulfate 6-O-sulfotransferase 1-B-like n=1 Tax=Gordionus sp. m RMFG-2023 TaxID=3053472 RepID=UPI0030DE624B
MKCFSSYLFFTKLITAPNLPKKVLFIVLLISLYVIYTLLSKENLGYIYFNIINYYNPNYILLNQTLEKSIFSNHYFDETKFKQIKFNFTANDVLVLIHIQKTGGTFFENKLTHHSAINFPCKCYHIKKTVCSCPRFISFNKNILNEAHITNYKKLDDDIEVDDDIFEENQKYNDINISSIDLESYPSKINSKNDNELKNLLPLADHHSRSKNRDMWLFARSTYSWKACGLHATWTDLNECVPMIVENKTKKEKFTKNYLYATILREPVTRYMSEFYHVKRGGTWKKSPHKCGGKFYSLPTCYDSKGPKSDWSHANMEEFMSCPYNLAHNRQTLHLADLESVGCYHKIFPPELSTSDSMSASKIHLALLNSAKKNLRDNLAFFGLLEHLPETQYLIGKMLGIHFKTSFDSARENYSRKNKRLTLKKLTYDYKLSNATLRKIARVNYLDIELYRFAKKLFFERIEYFKKGIERERENY